MPIFRDALEDEELSQYVRAPHLRPYKHKPTKLVRSSGWPTDRRVLAKDFLRAAHLWSKVDPKLYNLSKTDEPIDLMGHTKQITQIKFSTDDTELITVSSDNSLIRWNGITGQLRQHLKGHKDAVLCFDCQPNGRHIVSGSADNTVIIWNGDGKIVGRLRGHLGPINHVKFIDHHMNLITCSSDGRAIIWGADRKIKQEIELSKYEIVKICVSESGKRILLVPKLGPIKILDGIFGSHVRLLNTKYEVITSCWLSPNGERLVTNTEFGEVRLWDVDNGLHLEDFSGVYNGEGSILISDEIIINIMDSGTIYIHDVISGKYIEKISIDSEVRLGWVEGRSIILQMYTGVQTEFGKPQMPRASQRA